MLCRLELLQMSFTFTHMSVGIFRSTVCVLASDLPDFGQDFSQRCAIATKLVGDHNLGFILKSSQETLEELLSCFFVTVIRYENVQLNAILINRSPQVLLLTLNFEEDFVKVPGCSWARSSFLDLSSKVRSKFTAPVSDCFVANDDATPENKFRNFAQAQAKTMIKPNSVANDLNGETVAWIEAIAHRESPGKYQNVNDLLNPTLFELSGT